MADLSLIERWNDYLCREWNGYLTVIWEMGDGYLIGINIAMNCKGN